MWSISTDADHAYMHSQVKMFEGVLCAVMLQFVTQGMKVLAALSVSWDTTLTKQHLQAQRWHANGAHLV
jgi:hypothetical protein